MPVYIPYPLKVSETSNPDIKSYILEYYYFYVIKSKGYFHLQTDRTYVIEAQFFLEDNYYLIFWVKRPKEGFDMIKVTQPIYITIYLVKTEDSYMMGKDRIFQDMKDVIKQQYLDISYKPYDRKQIVSSVWFNLLTSNKILYHKYFIDEGIIINSTIENIPLEEINSRLKSQQDEIIKAPYSSASYCVTISAAMKKDCYIHEGVIVSKRNESIPKDELKMQVVNGEIVYYMDKSITSYSFVMDQNLKFMRNELIDGVTDEQIENRIKDIAFYKDEIESLVKKVYRLTNEFILIMKYKLTKELTDYIEPLDLKKETFYTFFTNKKLKKIETLKENNDDQSFSKKIDEYAKFIQLSAHEIKAKYGNEIDLSEEAYLDNYMRIDVMLPDNKYFKKVSLLEIEPFACGKGWIEHVIDAVPLKKSEKTNIVPSSSQSLMFIKIVQEQIKSKHSIKWDKIDNFSVGGSRDFENSKNTFHGAYIDNKNKYILLKNIFN